jgi:hypothetical protein
MYWQESPNYDNDLYYYWDESSENYYPYEGELYPTADLYFSNPLSGEWEYTENYEPGTPYYYWDENTSQYFQYYPEPSYTWNGNGEYYAYDANDNDYYYMDEPSYGVPNYYYWDESSQNYNNWSY